MSSATPQTSIWKAKGNENKEKSAETTASSKFKTSSSKRSVPEKAAAPKQFQYQAKLMTEENSDAKTALVKISSRTSIRQVINYSLGKIKSEWAVTFNAFQMEMTKALQACEIIKTRLPFLHQQNKFITYTVPQNES